VKTGRNFVAGLANSIWTAAVGLAVVPFYLHYLGVASYGLIGFFTAMQAVFGLLEMGLSPTMNREVARSQSPDDRLRARDLLHTLACVYWLVAAGIGLCLFIAAPHVARVWLHSSTLSERDLAQAIALMGLIIACRFPLGLYLGALMGAQRMVLASGIEIAMTAVANLGAVAVLALGSATIQAFFGWQALVAVLNVIIVRAAAWRALGPSQTRPQFDKAALGRIWRFSAGMALTAALGTVYLQSDKIVLSKLSSLSDLGIYSLAGLAARSLYLFLTPTFGAVYPRFTELSAASETTTLVSLYRSGTRALMSAIWPITVFMSLFAPDIFHLWTRDYSISNSISMTVTLLAFGTALNGAMHFPYALQLACGRSDLSAKINAALLIPYILSLSLLTHKFGISGAAGAWVFYNTSYLVVGTAVTDRLLLKGVGLRWLSIDVALPFLSALLIAGGGGMWAQSLPLNQFARLSLGGVFASLAFFAVVGLSPDLRRSLHRRTLFNPAAIDRNS